MPATMKGRTQMALTVAGIQHASDELVALRPRIGYRQNPIARRKCVNPKTLKWAPGTDGDCSFISFAVMLVAGLVVPKWRTMLLWSGNIIAVLVSTGYYKRIKVSQYKTLAALRAVVRPADVLRGPHHVVVVRDGKRWLSWEHAENGTLDGKTGWQKGEKTGYRGPYMRSKKWTDVARLISPSEFMGRILAAYQKGKAYTDPLHRLNVRAPHDGPLWTVFLAAWTKLDKGLVMSYTAAANVLTGHAFIVLGAGLKADGTMPAKFVHRLRLAKAALDLNPASKVIVTGGKPRKGVTEAAAGKAWLVAQGIAANRILTESAATSTIGNATGSLVVMRKAKIKTYTLVSDASHLRRASVLFLAAQLRIETAENVALGITPTFPLAFNDYGVSAVVTARPVSAKTRALVTNEVATLLRLTAQYQAAL